MSNNGLYSFIREGGWSSSYSSHYECAWLCFYEFEELINQLEKEEARLKNEVDIDEPHLHSFIAHETDQIHTEAYRSATSAHLYTCMAIEGFINFYGTKRLGEDLYKPILERVGITEKLSLLYLICFEKRLHKTDELIKSVRKVFDQRNSLVHPKTKEVTNENMHHHLYTHPSDLEIKNALNTLEYFIEEISKEDDSIGKDFHFRKPENKYRCANA